VILALNLNRGFSGSGNLTVSLTFTS